MYLPHKAKWASFVSDGVTVHSSTTRSQTYFNNQLNAQFLYSITICMLHYNPRHVSIINMPIFRRTNCIITASGIVTLCTVQHSMPDESRLTLQSSTCFDHQHAHLQEDKLYYHSIWYRHSLYSTAQYAG